MMNADDLDLKWKRLKKDYDEKGLVLILGAGVSQASDLPDWEELLTRLEAKVRQEGEPPILDTLKKDTYSLPAIVSVLEATYPRSGKDFARAIQEQLYRNFPFRSRMESSADDQAFIKHEKLMKNSTLRAVAGMCAIRQASETETFARNPRIHAIITTNVDSILRSYVHARYPRYRRESGDDGEHRYIIRSIDRASAGRIPGTIPVYYMHGFIRFDKDVSKVRKHAADLRVFTEQEFFDFFDNPNGLYNYTFLYLLREYPCLFIGLSLKDDNIRRLLHYSKKERVMSYEKEGRSREKAERRSNRHYLITKFPETECRKDKRLARLTESSLSRLGVNVLWVDTYPEICERLCELYEHPDDPKLSWADVFDRN